MDALVQLPFNLEGDRALIVAMGTLAKRSPQDAIGRALQWPNVAHRVSALSAIASQWAYRDPAAAFAWAEGDAPESARENLGFAVLRNWLNLDPVAAVEHVSSVKSIGRRNDLFAGAVPTLYSKDPTVALILLDQHVHGGRRIEVIELLVSRLITYSKLEVNSDG